jgi:hypothetical protein
MFDLSQFTGTENYYSNAPLFKSPNTDGVQYVAIEMGAFWLKDACLSHAEYNPKCMKQGFLTFKLTRKGEGASLVIQDGNYNTLDTQEIEYTDFPLPEIELWYENGVLYLPSER